MNEESEQTGDDLVNPYAAPVSTAAAMLPEGEVALTPPNPGRVIIKWLIVCSIAAGPSFFFGAGMGNWRLPEVLGMIAGVLAFAAGYSAIEFLPQVQAAMTQRVKRRATRIAYITRMGISILFPVGIFIDMYCGIVSVGFANVIVGGNGLGFGGAGFESPILRFLTFLLTTLIQGVLLNIILFAYMLIVYGFLRMLGVENSTPQAD